MKRFVMALGAALIAAVAFVGTGSDAEAGYRRCGNCGPVKPVYTYRTVSKVSHRTRYHNVTKVRHVTRIRPIVHVTRIRPVVKVHTVTRVHHRTVAVVRNVHRSQTVYLPTKYYSTSSVRHTYDCGCR